ncbi:phosphoribosylglycinamide formyltransferase [Enterococcus florum]|uniref:Phosphoribosylglycinamide formyltransferase n=1 Tax=Enterococcus florum TaxID=2480627 RepID=A0A4P5PDF6_9ENTE|nr:phosphoribosylglycinamide formyltransferase [Enterococcus florum]GCF94544.1 phosphoribosylglycinamide formyltransferase [Enterococcus florum]
MRLAVLASGNGSNFEAIVQSIEHGKIDAEIVLLFSDHRDAYVLERGKKHDVFTQSFELKEFENKASYEKALLELLQSQQVDLVILAGYMRIIGKDLLQAYPNRIINIHPALLPDFPGLHGIRDAFEARVEETGVTVHYVDDGVDTGPIIAQSAVKLDPADTLETLEEKIHAIEHQLYPAVIAKIVKDHQR